MKVLRFWSGDLCFWLYCLVDISRNILMIKMFFQHMVNCHFWMVPRTNHALCIRSYLRNYLLFERGGGGGGLWWTCIINVGAISFVACKWPLSNFYVSKSHLLTCTWWPKKCLQWHFIANITLITELFGTKLLRNDLPHSDFNHVM